MASQQQSKRHVKSRLFWLSRYSNPIEPFSFDRQAKMDEFDLTPFEPIRQDLPGGLGDRFGGSVCGGANPSDHRLTG